MKNLNKEVVKLVGRGLGWIWEGLKGGAEVSMTKNFV